MQVNFYPHRNLLMEVLLFPTLIIQDEQDSFSTLSKEQQQFIADVHDANLQLREELAPYLPEIKSILLAHNTLYLLPQLYLTVLCKGDDPINTEALFDCLQQLTTDELKHAIRNCFNLQDDGDFLTALQQHEALSDDYRWYWWLAWQNPTDHLKKSITLLREIAPYYLKIREQFAEESLLFQQEMSQTRIVELFQSSFIDSSLPEELIHDNTPIDCYVLSLPFLVFIMSGIDAISQTRWLFISPRIIQLMRLNEQFNDDQYRNILKLLSDPTAYQV